MGNLRGRRRAGSGAGVMPRKGIHETTFFNWKKQFGSIDVEEVREYRTPSGFRESLASGSTSLKPESESMPVKPKH